MPPRLSEAEIEKLRLLYEDSPLPVTAIALQAGHDASAIYSYARRRGWKPRAGRRQPRLPRAEIRALYEQTIVPVNEIARLAGIAEHTVYVYAAREGWKPRASPLRKGGAAGREITDLAAEVAEARRRAERECEWRELRSLEENSKELLRMAREEVRGQRRAARERAKKRGTYKRVWYSPQELVAHGLPGSARVYLPRPGGPSPPPAPSHGRDESE